MAATPLKFLIKRARLAKGLGLRELAGRIDLSPSALCRIESGELKTVSEEVLTRLARELDLNVGDVMHAGGKVPRSVLKAFWAATARKAP